MSDGAPNPDTVTLSAADHRVLMKTFETFNKLWDHPQHGRGVKLAAREIEPTMRIPELDVLEPAIAPLKAELEEKTKALDELRASFETDKAERALERDTRKLQTDIDAATRKYRLTPDGRNEMLEIIKRGEASTAESAAALIVANLEPAAPVQSGSNFGPVNANVLGIDGESDDADVRSLHRDPMKWLDSAVPRIINELEAGQEAA